MFLTKYVHYVNIVNAASLVGLSYLQIQDFNKYPYIIFPLFLGLFLVPMNNSLANKNKQIIKVATILSILALLALIFPSIQIFEKGDLHDKIRATTMIVVDIIAILTLISCVKKTKNNLI